MTWWAKCRIHCGISEGLRRWQGQYSTFTFTGKLLCILCMKGYWFTMSVEVSGHFLTPLCAYQNFMMLIYICRISWREQLMILRVCSVPQVKTLLINVRPAGILLIFSHGNWLYWSGFVLSQSLQIESMYIWCNKWYRTVYCTPTCTKQKVKLSLTCSDAFCMTLQSSHTTHYVTGSDWITNMSKWNLCWSFPL